MNASSGEGFAIAVAPANGARVVRLSGEFDLAGVDEFERHLHGDDEPKTKTTILDLRPLRFIDSSGLRALIRADAALRAEGARVVVITGAGQVAELLRMTGVADRLELADEIPSELRPDDAG